MAANGGGLTPVQELVAALRQFRCLNDQNARDLCLDLMARALGSNPAIRQHNVSDYFLVELAEHCLHDMRVMHALREALATLDSNTGAVEELDTVVRRVTAQSALTETGTTELRTLLAGLEVTRLTQLVRQVASPLQTILPPHDPWEAFEALSRMNAQPGGLPPGLAFVEYVAAEAPYDTAKALREWADEEAQALSLTARLRELRQQVVYATLPEPVDAYLVIRLLPQDEPHRYLLSSWRQYDPDGWHPAYGPSVPVTKHSAERAVQALVYEAEEEWAQDARCLHLEFILDSEELNLPVHLWRKELDSDHSTPLCMDYPVVVRSLERSRTKRWHRGWKQRWQFFETQSERARHLVIDGPDPDSPAPGDWDALAARLKADPSVVALVLGSPPGDTREGTIQARTAWRAGLPIVVWDRRDLRASELVPHLDDLTLVSLREGVQQLRLDAHAHASAERECHVGNHVALVWDDPTRPVEVQGRLAGPDEGVDSR